jgi:CheY-like chemotaxis protein
MIRAQILIIDENSTHQRLASLMAQRFGYKATVVTEVEEALKVLSYEPAIHVVLVDLGIPHSTKAVQCVRALTRLRKLHRRNFAIVANSAHAMESDVAEAIKLGADACMVKPYTSQDFRDMLRKWTPMEEQVRLAS